MPKISGTSVGQTAPATSQGSVSGVSPKSTTSKTQTVEKPPEKPSSEQTAGAKQHATGKAADAKLQAGAKGLHPQQSQEQQIKSIADAAKKSGLEDAQVAKLKGHLEKMDKKEFKSESSFLKNHVLKSPNADRALRTYNSLKDLQAKGKNSERLKQDHIHTLTRGVADPRAGTSRGKEGVLGQDAAEKAAKALVGMPKKDYDRMNSLLKHAGKDKTGSEVFGGSTQMEKALILKAAAARSEKLTHPNAKDRLSIWSGKGSSSMQEISQFAKDIRGSQRHTMATQSTATDPYLGNKALQQRWNDSCGPTTAQGMKAELDPIYAKQLHNEFIHSTRRGGAIGKEQKKVLESHGGVAVKRGDAGGAGTYLDKVLNSEVKKYTGVNYTANWTGGTVASRNAALDSAAEKLKKGIDVPVRAGWPGGGGHFMYMTDVRGSGPNQKFLLTDPWEGKTVWLTRAQLASGATPFPAGTGDLTHTY